MTVFSNKFTSLKKFLSSTYFDFFNLSSSFLSSISSAKATLKGSVFSLSKADLAILKFFCHLSLPKSNIFVLFWYFLCCYLCCFVFLLYSFFIVLNISFFFSIALLLFLFKRFSLKLLMASFCCFLNSSKSSTLFAASSMLSPLNNSSFGSSTYATVSRSSSFTKNAFFVCFKFLYF